MDKIRRFLADNGYECYELENFIEFNDARLRCQVIKKDGYYLIRNAIRCYFDRWANSGTEFKIETEDDVIKYFSTPEKCIKDAVSELVETICEDAGWNNDYSRVNKMIDSLYDLIEKDESD